MPGLQHFFMGWRTLSMFWGEGTVRGGPVLESLPVRGSPDSPPRARPSPASNTGLPTSHPEMPAVLGVARLFQVLFADASPFPGMLLPQLSL